MAAIVPLRNLRTSFHGQRGSKQKDKSECRSKLHSICMQCCSHSMSVGISFARQATRCRQVPTLLLEQGIMPHKKEKLKFGIFFDVHH